VHETDWKLVLPGRAGVPVRPSSGKVVVAAGYGANVVAARVNLQARELLSYRVVGSSIEMLLPPLSQHKAIIDGRSDWRPAFTLPELSVDARARS
jgi:hypothetical protein